MLGSLRVNWVGAAVLACGLSLTAAEPPAVEAPKPNAEELKKKYPFVSVADRLTYEVDKAGAATKLPAESAKRLDLVERDLKFKLATDQRARSLRMLHQTEVKNFVDRDLAGVLRMRAPSLHFVDLPKAPPVPFASQAAGLLTSAEAGPSVTLPKTTPKSGGLGLPALDTLADFHRGGILTFAGPNTFGLVKNRDQVAGFEPHQFAHMPWTPQTPERKDEKWLIARLELVSLLKHEKPAVYVSEHLPRMEDLKKAKIRSLSEFEEKGLKALQAGEDLVTEATTNRIYMVGAMRAASQCLDCHHGQRGDLLGTFSYELRREPPVRGEK